MDTTSGPTPFEQIASCQECGRPWGAILKRGVGPSDELQAIAQAQMVDELLGLYDETLRVDKTLLPQVTPVDIVYVTGSLARFVAERLNGDAFLEECWQEIGDTDLPAWLLKGRRRRIAYRWNCCEIGHIDQYTRGIASHA